MIIKIHKRTMGLSLALSLGLTVIFCRPCPALAATAPPLGNSDSFAVLAGTSVTNTGNTTISGDLGVSPGNTITGFPPGTVVGTTHGADAAASAAQTDVTTAYNNLASQPFDADLSGQDLGGRTLTAGVYHFSTSAQLTGTLTLDALGDPAAVFIFQMGSTLTTADNSSVLVINGGQDCNVFWQVGSSATLGINSTFAGNILALTSITVQSGATISGRTLARTGTVTLDTNTVSVCSLFPALGIVKSVQTYSDPVNGVSGPKAIPGSFMLYTILVTNTGPGTVDNNETVITDAIPANTELFVGDLNGAGSGPVFFADGATPSGLSYSFASLASAVDNLSFSNDGATSFIHAPAADANQCDAAITHVRISFGGIFDASDGTSHPSFSVKFMVRVK